MEIEKQKSTSWRELLSFATILLVVVFFIRIFIATPFVVSGSSMFPTFLNGDYLIVDRLSYRLSNPERGDVVVFLYPNDPENSSNRNFIVKFLKPGKSFIKRIIGLPNEIVEIKDGIVTITNKEHKDGFALSEPYVKNTDNSIRHFELKNSEYFVMGDNRTGSSDSRTWGAVNKNFLEGRPFLRLWPVSKINILPGNYKQAE